MTMSRWTAKLYAMLTFNPMLAQADAIFEWNAIMVEQVLDQPPPDQNRFAAITQLAVFEAVNAVTGEYRPYLEAHRERSPGRVTAMPGASADAAAVSAAHRVLRTYFPERADVLDAARVTSLARIPDGPAKDGGIAVGEAAAKAMIAARTNDGSTPPESYLPASSNAGEWQPTPDCPPTGGLFLHWRNVKPFAMRRADQFRSDPPPLLTSDRYTRSFKEVKEVGVRDTTERPQDRADVVRLYEVLSDAALWNPIATQMAADQGFSQVQIARIFALLNMALSDGGVAVMDTKYHYNFWRPETSIVAAAVDGNERTHPDASYVPLIGAPCFPSYPSGHATTSYAARKVLEGIFGRRGGPSITVSSPAVPDVILKYGNLEEITSDIDDARVYGGIHFRFDQEEGAELGLHVGAYILQASLKPVSKCTCKDEDGE